MLQAGQTQKCYIENDRDPTSIFFDFIKKYKENNFKRLILIQPSLVPKEFFDKKTAVSGGYYNFPPIGLLYLAASAYGANRDLDVKILDLNHELLKAAHAQYFEYEECLKSKLQEVTGSSESFIFGVSYMFGTTKPCFEETVRLIKKNYPGSLVMCGGVQATFDAEELILSGYVDIVVSNEGEWQFAQVISSLKNTDIINLPNGSWISVDGKPLQFNKRQEAINETYDLRNVYDLIQIEDYYKYGNLGAFSRFVGESLPFSTVLSRRGCRARCTFCTVRNFNGLGVRKRSVDSVIEEIQYLVNERGIRYIDWLDDDLLFDKEQALLLFKTIAKKIPNLKWTASNGLIGVSIDEEMMDAMAESGLQAYKIGIESGNDKILHQIKKPTTKKKLIARKDIFVKHKHILFSTNLIIGFPEEKFSQMIDTYLFAQQLEQDWASFYIMQPLRGTEMYSAFQSLGDERCNVESYDKTINPGRSSERGEFGYKFIGAKNIQLGWDVFNIPPESKPGLEQQKEIWFTFNLTANFLNNPNYKSTEGTEKILKWLKSIHAGYPYDASMVAAMAHCYHILENQPEFLSMQMLFLNLTEKSDYWKDRCHQFPELLKLVGLVDLPGWYNGPIPSKLFRYEIIDRLKSMPIE